MLTMTVSGMTCDHCVSAVANAVKAAAGVEDVNVDLKSGQLTVAGTPNPGAVREAIAAAGYEVQAA